MFNVTDLDDAELVSEIDMDHAEALEIHAERETDIKRDREVAEDLGLVAPAPKLAIHTGGELHPVPSMRVPDFIFNLSRLLDDPARKPDADLVRRTGLDARMEDFVFCTEGAGDLFDDMVSLVSRQLERGKDVTVLILCRGGKHRSVAFGENLASHFEVKATHHHIDLPIVKYTKTEGR